MRTINKLIAPKHLYNKVFRDLYDKVSDRDNDMDAQGNKTKHLGLLI